MRRGQFGLARRAGGASVLCATVECQRLGVDACGGGRLIEAARGQCKPARAALYGREQNACCAAWHHRRQGGGSPPRLPQTRRRAGTRQTAAPRCRPPPSAPPARARAAPRWAPPPLLPAGAPRAAAARPAAPLAPAPAAWERVGDLRLGACSGVYGCVPQTRQGLPKRCSLRNKCAESREASCGRAVQRRRLTCWVACSLLPSPSARTSCSN